MLTSGKMWRLWPKLPDLWFLEQFENAFSNRRKIKKVTTWSAHSLIQCVRTLTLTRFSKPKYFPIKIQFLRFTVKTLNQMQTIGGAPLSRAHFAGKKSSFRSVHSAHPCRISIPCIPLTSIYRQSFFLLLLLRYCRQIRQIKSDNTSDTSSVLINVNTFGRFFWRFLGDFLGDFGDFFEFSWSFFLLFLVVSFVFFGVFRDIFLFNYVLL